MDDKQLRELKCPHCPARFTAVVEIGCTQADLKPGGFVFCNLCSRGAVLTEDTKLRKPTLEDRARFDCMEPLGVVLDEEGKLWDGDKRLFIPAGI